jgi:hypothetical protein
MHATLTRLARSRDSSATHAQAMERYVYIDVYRPLSRMSRKIQIALTDRQHAFLRDEAERTGLSSAELIRRAIDVVYRPETRPRISGVDLKLELTRGVDAAVRGRRVPSPSVGERLARGRR